MPKYINTTADELLGFPAFFRVVYDRGWGIDIDLQRKVDALAARLYGATGGKVSCVPVLKPQVSGDEPSVVIDFSVQAFASTRTVADLTADVDMFSYLAPFSSPQIVSVARVTAAQVSGERGRTERANAAKKREDEQKDESLIEQLKRALRVVLVIVVLVLIVAALVLGLKAKKELSV